ncbi:P-loop containing nucleoside triphosphate hydrolase protein [Nadsonia fulvescens var. elongata DSM 6958]|uniref:p-loop containing nucleoside triphosphate hydrolase protein n=1 Tax=Nadsonia fulvescens var. elongata DSM 6958 TaxID=857566 RepID=A0A1E3PFB6_9ASCO|nr:P-loop containing nucleoside triphosphate hydrolase protein [Nadsonia fulvescens var. elongata DSM 6958]
MAAAELEEMTVSTDHIELPSSDAPLIVEGAGGLYVPLNEEKMIIDIIKQLDLPVILVARSTLGTINHTLLSLRALAEYNIPVAGVVLSGPINSSNRKTIEQFGNVRVIFEIPQFDEITPAVVNDFASTVENFESTLLPLKK